MADRTGAGYIVLCGGRLCSLSEYDGVMVLTFGGPGALFTNYDAARTAARRTSRYGKRHGFNWASNYTIRPLHEVSRG